MPEPGGTIYAIGTQGTALVKIGFTTNAVEQRLKQLQTGQPFPLSILATVAVASDVQRVERQVHAFLKAERQRGEWFDIAVDEVSLGALIHRALQAIAEEEPTGVHEGTLGQRILQRRRELCLTQGELAARVGCPTALISHLERGKQDVFSNRLALIATALDVSADYLLGLTDTPRRRLAPPATEHAA